jgi:predicted DNA-binding transcriptional regulator AlpA
MTQTLLTEAEAAEYLSASRMFLRKMRMRQAGPAWVRMGSRAIRYSVEDLNSWIQAQRYLPRVSA